MTEETRSEVLDFGGANSSISKTPTSSHLSNNHSRHESSLRNDNKRKKPNIKQVNKSHLSAQKEKVKILVHQVIDLILQESKLEYSFDIYYRGVESLCRFKHIEQSILADHLKLKLEDHFHYHIKPDITRILEDNLLTLSESITKYLEIYEKWKHKLQLLSKLFLYLDRCYLMQHPSRKMILELGMTLFVEGLLADNNEGTNRLADITLRKHIQLLKKVGEFEDIRDLKLAKQLSTVLVKLNFNHQIRLHTDLINLIISHYNSLKDLWIEKPETYIHIALTKISREMTFFKDCGYEREFLIEFLLKLKWVLIFQNFNTMIKSCIPFMVHDKNLKQFEIIYDYCGRSLDEYQLDAMSIFVYEWGQHIIHSIKEIIDSNKSNLKKIIPLLVESNLKYKSIADDKFNKNELFEFEVRKSFTKSFNEKKINTLIIFQLCKYCDSFFKNINKKSNKDESINLSFNEFQQHVLIIFKALNNKNDFISHYKKELSKRLLLGKSPSYSLERKLVESFLKLIGEGEETVGLQIMFKDLELSKEKYSLMTLDDSPVDFTALVLEQKHWPEMPKLDSDIILLPQLTTILDSFTALYHNSDEKLKNRTLDWSHYPLHQLTIKANFDNGEKELDVNLLQAIVILLFNDKNSYTYDEIFALSNISDKLLKKVLGSLSSDKYRILLKDNATYSFNSKFTDKAIKIKIPLSKDREISTGLFDSDATKALERNRSIEFRSALVRVMKSAKRISYLDLLTQTLPLVEKNGPCTITDLKSNLEYLIENEFVKRELDGQTLSYVP